MKVSNTLGAGFSEKVYENALCFELRQAGLKFVQQATLTVRYEGVVMGEFIADVVVEGCVLLELKAAKTLDEAHKAQLLNYLTATNLRLGLLLNFGTPRVGIKRLVL